MNEDRRIHKSRQALQESLLMLMKTSPLAKITVTEIVQHADLNRGTFYKHYDSKEQLLDEIVDDVLEDLVRSYRAPYSDKEVFVLKELSASKIKIFEHVYRHAQFYKVIVDSSAFQGFQTRICDVLKRLSKDDLMRLQTAPSKVDEEFLASYSAHALFGFIIEWINSDFKYTPSFMAEQLMDILHTSPSDAVYFIGDRDLVPRTGTRSLSPNKGGSAY